MFKATQLLAVALLLTGSGALVAQTDRANLTGSVTDPSGGAVPGATVTATHVETNAARTAVANANQATLV